MCGVAMHVSRVRDDKLHDGMARDVHCACENDGSWPVMACGWRWRMWRRLVTYLYGASYEHRLLFASLMDWQFDDDKWIGSWCLACLGPGENRLGIRSVRESLEFACFSRSTTLFMGVSSLRNVA